jgi:hypothetical protein
LVCTLQVSKKGFTKKKATRESTLVDVISADLEKTQKMRRRSKSWLSILRMTLMPSKLTLATEMQTYLTHSLEVMIAIKMRMLNKKNKLNKMLNVRDKNKPKQLV